MPGVGLYYNEHFACFPKIRWIKVFDIADPRNNEQIFPVSWHFIKSMFHYICTPGIGQKLPFRTNAFVPLSTVHTTY